MAAYAMRTEKKRKNVDNDSGRKALGGCPGVQVGSSAEGEIIKQQLDACSFEMTCSFLSLLPAAAAAAAAATGTWSSGVRARLDRFRHQLLCGPWQVLVGPCTANQHRRRRLSPLGW